jgi:SCY1-like protein 1
VLPSLAGALDFGGAHAPAIVPLLLQLGAGVPADEYEKAVLAPLVKLFANPDRGVRMALLDALPEYAEKLDKKTVNDKIWPHLVTAAPPTEDRMIGANAVFSKPGSPTLSRSSEKPP